MEYIATRDIDISPTYKIKKDSVFDLEIDSYSYPTVIKISWKDLNTVPGATAVRHYSHIRIEKLLSLAGMQIFQQTKNETNE